MRTAIASGQVRSVLSIAAQLIGAAYFVAAYTPGAGDVGYVDQVARHAFGSLSSLIALGLAVAALRSSRGRLQIATFVVSAVLVLYALGTVAYILIRFPGVRP